MASTASVAQVVPPSRLVCNTPPEVQLVAFARTGCPSVTEMLLPAVLEAAMLPVTVRGLNAILSSPENASGLQSIVQWPDVPFYRGGIHGHFSRFENALSGFWKQVFCEVGQLSRPPSRDQQTSRPRSAAPPPSLVAEEAARAAARHLIAPLLAALRCASLSSAPPARSTAAWQARGPSSVCPHMIVRFGRQRAAISVPSGGARSQLGKRRCRAHEQGGEHAQRDLPNASGS